MGPEKIKPEHHAILLRNNAQYVHWLAPLDADGLMELLGWSSYQRQFNDGDAVLLGYDGYSDYRHKNVDWLAQRLDDFFYIDRVIIGDRSQRQGLARRLYDDLAAHARSRGFRNLACEVSLSPDNPGSHTFHLAYGFKVLGEDEVKTLRYYALTL